MDKLRKINIPSIIRQSAVTLLLNAMVTLLLLMLQKTGFIDINAVVVYILTVLITSRYTKGYFYGVLASVISMLSYNFYFTEPVYTFKVDDRASIITLIIMLLSSIFTSTLASKLIHSKELADEREKETRILYSISSALAKTSDLPEAASVSAVFMSSLLECDVLCILLNQKEHILQMFYAKKGVKEAEEATAGLDDLQEAMSGYTAFPLNVRGNTVGYLCIGGTYEEVYPGKGFLLDSVIIQLSTAMERVILIRDREAAKSETERERFKSSLLRAISHDIRTPLTRITGAAQILQNDLGEEESRKLIQGIYEDSSWLTRLVENILSLTRMQEGKLNLRIQPEAVEEIVSGAIRQARKFSPDRGIIISIPDEVLFVPMDGKLIEQVLINLIINSMEHTAPENDIHVLVKPDNEVVWFEVRDKGSGIDKADLPHIFDMFYVSDSGSSGGKQGIGLGLAICKAIVNMHGGNILAESTPGEGSVFRFYLKLKDNDTSSAGFLKFAP